MAQSIIGNEPTEPKKELIYDETYRHSIIQSTETPHTSLLSQVPGEPVLVEWYRQIRGADEEPQGFEPDSPLVYSSYSRINNLIIKYDGMPSYMFDPQTATGSQNGIGFVLFDLTPLKGDLFIKDIGDGRAGLFIIHNQPELKTVNLDKVYQIEFQLKAIVTKSIMDVLNKKVVKELYYSKDSIINGGNAVLTGTDITYNKRLYDLQLAITEDIVANHYYDEENTIVVPLDGIEKIYDPYLAKFLNYTLPTRLLGMRKKIELLNVNYFNNDKMQESITIWDMFYKGDLANPKRFKRDYFIHEREHLINTRMYGNVFFSKIDRVILVTENSAPKAPYGITGALLPTAPTSHMTNPIRTGTEYEYYFSESFYDGVGEPKEQFIWKMFKDKTLDKKGVIDLMDNYWNLSDLDKVYLGGIYVLCAKIALVKNSNYN